MGILSPRNLSEQKLFDEFQDDLVFKELTRGCPTILSHYKEDIEFGAITREEVAEYVVRNHDNLIRSADNETGRIFLGWRLNHLAHVVSDLINQEYDLVNVYKLDIDELFKKLDYILINATPELCKTIQCCFVEYMVSTLHQNELALGRLFLYLNPYALYLSTSNESSPYHKVVGFICHRNNIKSKKVKHLDLSQNPSPAVDYGILIIERYIYNNKSVGKKALGEPLMLLGRLKSQKKHDLRKYFKKDV